MVKLAYLNEHKIDLAANLFGYGLFGSTAITVVIFIITSVLYYINIKYHLGITMLTDFFA